jgi:hypothetical protein
MQSGYKEDNWGDPVISQLIGSSAREAEESPLLGAVAMERLMKSRQAGKRLGGCCGDL